MSNNDQNNYIFKTDFADYAELLSDSAFRSNVFKWFDYKLKDSEGDRKRSILYIGQPSNAINAFLEGLEAEIQTVAYDHNDPGLAFSNIRKMSLESETAPANNSYDYILVAGCPLVPEDLLIPGMNALETLFHELNVILKPEGTILFAADNEFGIRYITGTERLADEVYVERNELCNGILKNGFDFKAYYPYPDYRFTEAIYSDDRLPKPGDIKTVTPSYVNDRFDLMDEVSEIDRICRKGRYPDHSNSFLFVCYKKGTALEPSEEQDVEYVKFNTGRAPEYRISTRIVEMCGRRYAVKKAECPEAKDHLDSIVDNYQKLQKIYDKMSFVKPEVRDDEVWFDFVAGDNLGEKLVKNLADRLNKVSDPDNEETFKKALKGYAGFLNKITDSILLNKNSEEKTYNIDCIPANIVITSETMAGMLDDSLEGISADRCMCIDYEWVSDDTADGTDIDKYLEYRIYRYLYNDIAYLITDKISPEDFVVMCGIDMMAIPDYEAMEDKFQQKVHGENRKYLYLPGYQKEVINKSYLELKEIQTNAEIGNLKGIIANREERLRHREEQLADIKKSIKNPIYGVKTLTKYKKK